MTPVEVYSLVRNQCAETSVEFWTENEIYSLMSIAEKQIAQRIGNIEAKTSLTTTTSTKTYSIASSVSGIITRLTYDTYRLEGININEIDTVEGKAYGGVTIIGQPEYYYRYGDTLGFSPTPDSSHTVDIYYRATPVTVTTSSTAFTVPSEYTQYIPDYCLYRMMLKDQELRNEAVAYKGQWDENLRIINNHHRSKKTQDTISRVVIHDPMVDF